MAKAIKIKNEINGIVTTLTEQNKLLNDRPGKDVAQKIFNHTSSTGGTWQGTEEGLTDLSTMIDIPIISLSILLAWKDIETNAPVTVKLINGCRMRIERSFVPETEKKTSAGSAYLNAKERDKFRAKIAEVLKVFAPRFMYTVKTKDYWKEYTDFTIVSKTGEEPINVIMTLPSSIRKKTVDGCAILKRAQNIPNNTRTIITGISDNIKSDKEVLITPFMHEMNKSGYPVVVFDLTSKKPYLINFEDDLTDIIRMSRKFKLIDAKPFNQISDMKFEPMIKINPETQEPYNIKTRILKGFK